MILLLLPAIPLIAALLTLFTPKNNEGALKALTLVSTGACFALTLFLYSRFDSSAAGYQYAVSFTWLPDLGIRYSAGLDGINMTLCILQGLVSFAGAFVSCWPKEGMKKYLFFYLVLTSAIYGVFTVTDIFFLYLFYEMTLIPLYPMIGMWGSRSTSGGKTLTPAYGAMKLTLFITTGAVLTLFGIMLLYRETGMAGFGLEEVRAALAAKPLDPHFQKTAAGLFLVGFGVIASLWPLHSWSPIGYAAAPTAVSMVHAGVLKKIGPYLILRLAVGLLPAGTLAWGQVLAILSGIGILYAGYAAIKQQDLKFMIGFSSVSHMGYILLGIAAMTPTSLSGTVLLMFSHGVMAAATFAVIGFLYEPSHYRGVKDFGGLGRQMPFIAICFVMACMASLGLPGFSNFVSELLIFIGSWNSYPVVVGLAVFGVLITSIYLLRAVQSMCFGPANPKWAHLKDARTLAERFPFVLLLGALMLVGFWPQTLLRIIKPAVLALTAGAAS